MKMCPFFGCKNTIQDNKFACYRHWHGLSQQEKMVIHEELNSLHSGITKIDQYRRAAQQVVDAAQKRISASQQEKCWKCGAEILWVRFKRNALIALDMAPTDDGTVVIKDGKAQMFPADPFEHDDAKYRLHPCFNPPRNK